MPKIGMPLNLYSEVVQPTGGLAGAGAVKVMGQPKLSPLALVLRESIQNSWDARNGARQVRFAIERRRLNREDVEYLVEQVFPGAVDVGMPVARALRRRPELLILTDMGTVGLEGPVRADEIEEEEPRRFVDFFRNIGSHQQMAGTGGTYGFGKTSLYRLSKSHAIAAFSRARPTPGATLEARFMAAGIGESLKLGNRWLTGRHWWGKAPRVRDPVVDPVVGDAAVRIAKELGMLFSYNEAGTSIAVLSPKIEDGEEFRMEVVETLLYNFWPKMLPGESGDPHIAFTFIDDDQEVAIMDPRKHPKVKPFVDAYSGLSRANRVATSSAVTVSTGGAQVEVGKVAYVRAHRQPVAALKKKSWEPIGDVCHHVCLLRTPELVVTYEKTQPPIGAIPGYAAVFRAYDQWNETFASAEPPSHDEWEPSGLPKRQREIVNRTLKELRRIMKTVADPSGSATGTGTSVTPLGNLASFLGELLDGVDADGPQVAPAGGVRPVTGGGGRKGLPGRIEVVDTIVEESSQTPGAVIAAISVDLKGAEPGARVRVLAKAGVQTADGIETEAPEGEPGVEILSWRDERGVELATADEVEVTTQIKATRLTVVASVPERLIGAIAFTCRLES